MGTDLFHLSFEKRVKKRERGIKPHKERFSMLEWS